MMRSLRLYQPQTLDAAAELLVELLDQEMRDALREVDAEEAVDLTHASVGLAIRNAWVNGPGGAELRAGANAYRGNPGLPQVGADEISAAIIRRAWRILKEQS